MTNFNTVIPIVKQLSTFPFKLQIFSPITTAACDKKKQKNKTKQNKTKKKNNKKKTKKKTENVRKNIALSHRDASMRLTKKKKIRTLYILILLSFFCVTQCIIEIDKVLTFPLITLTHCVIASRLCGRAFNRIVPYFRVVHVFVVLALYSGKLCQGPC